MVARVLALLMTLGLLLTTAGCPIGLRAPDQIPDDDDDASGSDDDDSGDDDDATGDDDDATGDDDDATGDDDDATGDDDDATGDDDDATGDDDDSTIGDDDDSTGSGPVCDPLTTLTGATGTFDDGSGAGVDYDNNVQCGWLIGLDASVYESVTVSFSMFDVENTYDFVNVYDGADATAPLLGALTGTTLPADVTSTSPQIYVEFVTDSTVTADGFDAAWAGNLIGTGPTGCSGNTTLTGATGTFDDGSGAADYDNNLQCGWLIDTDASLYGSVTLSFSAFDLENTYDYVNVYDGPDANATLLMALTGTSLPADVTSTTSQMFVELVTDSIVTAGGFEASWTANPVTTTGCSGTTTLTGATGTFDDGSGTADYDNSSQCGWLIDTDASLFGSVTLSFSAFDLENTFDFVNVYDGPDANASLLVSLTGTTLPADVTSTTNQLFVELVTDSSVTAGGFDASWVANPIVTTGCSGTTTLTGATGTFDDGSGAGVDYDNNSQCGWLIDASGGGFASVTLSFSSFDLENTFDFVNVYDGADANATLLVSLTGTSLPADVTSTGDQLFVELMTDSSVTAEGFEASWTANLPPPTCTGNTTLTGATGTFEDGSGAGDYDNDLQCGWLIDASGAGFASVTLSFSSFDLENTFDFVNVYDGPDASAPLLVTLTGTSLPADVTSTSDQLFVELDTDSSVTAGGFEASWTANLPPPTCTGTTTLTGATGTFDDGSGAGTDYSNNLQCGWLIDASGAGFASVTLSFSSFDLENNFDYVNVYDGPDANAPLLVALTGTSVPADVTSTSDQLFVELDTDSSVTAGGFEASWTANLPPPTCSGTTTFLTASGTFEDGSGAGDYDNDLQCGWLIDVDPTLYGSVTLSFSSFDLENNFDYVRVYDGADANATLLGSFTGSSLPGNVTSTTNQLFVELDTDISITAGGFSAGWTGNPIPAGCSGTTLVTAPSGSITDGPGDYASNSTCGWLIDVPGAEAVTLSFSAFDTESGFDFVTVYDGVNTTAPVLLDLSGNGVDLNVTLVATLGPIFVEFTSDNIINAPGFTADYTTFGAADECLGAVTLTDPIGALSDGAGDYANNALCSWTIAVEEASGIELTFGSLETEEFFDFLDIFDGADTDAALLASYDGLVTPPTLTSNNAQVHVQLDTDSTVTAPGFTATYAAQYVQCSGTQTLTASTGGFGDGSGPGVNYTTNRTCNWLIDAPAGSTIQVTADWWSTETGWDWIKLYDGNSASAPVLVNWTGAGSNSTWTTTGNQAYVRFRSDGSLTSDGFWIEYTVIP